ncbi:MULTISPECIES: ATP-binding protein [Calothrix]|uniref:histidine kinase n=2 Tax=Calothrix TaxID=1186 RepID=A0ABR8AEX8_9CYAN|nr:MULTISPECIES: ATP-binding protein [Calothrix]MBD2197092.1 GAF domain-containing protein [Calothrix parietina FACHB-288]MBD2225687.1 GAF domain-containing protein [Calothrix anomala FACHB-343]
MTVQTVDLTNCDREPIHIPGLIQPHGVLLAINLSTIEIIQVSNNTANFLYRQPEDLLGKPLSQLFEAKQIVTIQQCLNGDFESLNPLHLSIKHEGKTLRFDGIVHQWDGVALLELEPKNHEGKADFFNFYQQVKGVITKIQKAATMEQMCQLVVKEVRKITEFERVMIYRFDDDETGIVIAEDTDREIPYLDLRYPPSDIPKQARKLYTSNWLRIIPSVNYQPVELIPTNNPLTNQPLDLSLSVLRSVSPIHLEYLQNMGVGASMSISLVHDKKLWGLIACHHSSAKYIPYSIRAVCEFIGQVMSLELANKEASEDQDYKMQLKSLQTQFVESLSQAQYFLDGIAQMGTELLSLVSATGAVICNSDRCIRIGETPPEAEIPVLLDWIKPQLEDNLFHTRSLSHIYPAAEAFKAVASGVLALEISRIHRHYIVWFRPEVQQTVNWGGNPDKPVEVADDGSLRLSPRKSFALWKQIVKGYSLAWKPCEIAAVAELRSLIVGVVLRQADELASMNMELQRSNEELDSFAYVASHDLKEPLRGIHNYANFLMEDYSDILNEDGVAKLQTLVKLTQRMENLINSLLHFSRLGRAELMRQPVNLQDLVQQAIATLTISRPQSQIDFRIPQNLPTIECDRAQVNEVFTNLIGNAIKYNDKPERWVEIGFIANPKTTATSSYTFYVRDNGIGIPEEHQEKVFQIFRRLHGREEYGGGNGAGLTIARKIVERHGGKIWVESIINEGSTFYFTLATEVG